MERALVLTVTLASVLVPAWASPSRTISIPLTEAKVVHFAGSHGPNFESAKVTFAFDPTHVAFVWKGDPGTGVRYRTIAPGRGTSRWLSAPESADLDHGKTHYSGVLWVAGARALQWRPVVPAGAEMGSVSLDYMNTLDGPRVTEEIPSVAEAAAKTPQIVTRAQWGADESIKRTRGGCVRQFYPVQQLFVHHTAGTNFDPHPKATMRAIYYFHTVVRGWCDIGYNFVIGPDGSIYEGRWARRYAPWETHSSETRSGLAVMGAHVKGYNSGSVGISLMGNFSQIRPPPSMRHSLAKLLAWEADRHHLRPRHSHTYVNPVTGLRRKLPYIAGHRDAGATECPGNYLYAALPAIRRDTAAIIGQGKKDSQVSLKASADLIRYRDEVTFSGRLATHSGVAIGDATLHIYKRPAGGDWSERTKARTASDGSFSFPLSPWRNVKVLVAFDGNATTWGAESHVRRVGVKPVVRLNAEGGTTDPSGNVHYPSGTSTVPLSGAVKPDHPGSKMTVQVFGIQPDGSLVQVASAVAILSWRSIFHYGFPVPGAGTYQAIARFPGDADHVAASSNRVNFIVDP